MADIESGPTTRSLGFTEPALTVTLSNTGKREVIVTDHQLMFSGSFGLRVLPEASGDQSHPALPVGIAIAEERVWDFLAQATSRILDALFMPANRTGHGVVVVYDKCRFIPA